MERPDSRLPSPGYQSGLIVVRSVRQPLPRRDADRRPEGVPVTEEAPRPSAAAGADSSSWLGGATPGFASVPRPETALSQPAGQRPAEE